MRAGDISLTCGQELTQKVLAVSFLWLLTLGLAETKLFAWSLGLDKGILEREGYFGLSQ